MSSVAIPYSMLLQNSNMNYISCDFKNNFFKLIGISEKELLLVNPCSYALCKCEAQGDLYKFISSEDSEIRKNIDLLCKFVETSTMNSNYNPNCRYSALKYSSCALLQLLVELQKIGTCGTRISMNLSTENFSNCVAFCMWARSVIASDSQELLQRAVDTPSGTGLCYCKNEIAPPQDMNGVMKVHFQYVSCLIDIIEYMVMILASPSDISECDSTWLLPYLHQTVMIDTDTGSIAISHSLLKCLKHISFQIALKHVAVHDPILTNHVSHKYIYESAVCIMSPSASSAHIGQGSGSSTGGAPAASRPLAIGSNLYNLVICFGACPVMVLQSHMGILVECLNQCLSIHYVELQMLVLDAFKVLCYMCPRGVSPFCIRIMVEVLRVHIYYARGCSDMQSLMKTQAQVQVTAGLRSSESVYDVDSSDKVNPLIDVLLEECRSLCLLTFPKILKDYYCYTPYMNCLKRIVHNSLCSNVSVPECGQSIPNVNLSMFFKGWDGA